MKRLWLVAVLILSIVIIGCGSNGASVSVQQTERDTSSIEKALIGHWENDYWEYYYNGKSFFGVRKSDGCKEMCDYYLKHHQEYDLTTMKLKTSEDKMDFTFMYENDEMKYVESMPETIQFSDDYGTLIKAYSEYSYVDSKKAP